MRFFILTFLISTASTYALIKIAPFISAWRAVAERTGRQSLHTTPIPRIGGLAVLVALACGALQIHLYLPAVSAATWTCIAGGLVAAMIGLTEDFTAKVSVRARLIWVGSVSLACTLNPEFRLTRSDMGWLDAALGASPLVAGMVTAFVITGLTNAFNIIDGLNGLSSACTMIILSAISYAAFSVNDHAVAIVAIAAIGAVAGFFVWNYPGGFIFLGDGGAYLCGFMVASLGLLLIDRNPYEVSPIFPLLLCIYPIAETCFSMYRRGIKRHPISRPDRGHLHSLLFRRLDGRLSRKLHAGDRRRNSWTTPYLWALCLGSVIPAVLFYNSFWALIASLLGFVALYIALYLRIVRFRTPKWL